MSAAALTYVVGNGLMNPDPVAGEFNNNNNNNNGGGDVAKSERSNVDGVTIVESTRDEDPVTTPGDGGGAVTPPDEGNAAVTLEDGVEDADDDSDLDFDSAFQCDELVALCENDILQKKIDLEMKIMDGTTKMMAACPQGPQAIEVAKNFVTSKARLYAYMSELQKRKIEEVHRENRHHGSSTENTRLNEECKPCCGKVSVSDVRIPLMWKNQEHFKNKGDYRQFSVFCLLSIGTNIQDTQILSNVDRSCTDLCFDDVLLFSDVNPDFQIHLEVYSYRVDEDCTLASTPRRLSKRFNKLTTLTTQPSSDRALKHQRPTPSPLHRQASYELPDNCDIRYTKLATATMDMKAVSDSVKSHDLILHYASDGSDLPLFGYCCCRVAAQPTCMTSDMMCGFLHKQEMIGDLPNWTRLRCVIRQRDLLGWVDPEDMSDKPPYCTVHIDEDAAITPADRALVCRPNTFTIHTTEEGVVNQHMISCDSKQDCNRWMAAFRSLLINHSTWKQACKSLLSVRVPTPVKNPAYLHTGSLYDDTSAKGKSMDDLVNACQSPTTDSAQFPFPRLKDRTTYL